MIFADFLKNEQLLKENAAFNWKDYVKKLEIILDKEENKDLHNYVNDFILVTDLIDDLMDKDNLSKAEYLVNNQCFLAQYLFEIITRIKSCVSNEKYRLFIDHIGKCLYYQGKDLEYKVSVKSCESDYFILVNKSVLLSQSIIYLVDSSPPYELIEAVKYLTISAQIENDMGELDKKIPYDLLDKKGTFPIIKAIEWAKEKEDRKGFRENFEYEQK